MSIFDQLTHIKEMKRDKIQSQCSIKNTEIINAEEELKSKESFLEELISSYKNKKDDIYAQHFSGDVTQRSFDKINHEVFKLDQEIDLAKKAIERQEDVIANLKKELLDLQELLRVADLKIHKFNIISEDIKKEEKFEELKRQDEEIEEASQLRGGNRQYD